MRTQAKQPKFSELRTTKTGTAGEEIVKEILEQKGYKVYAPTNDSSFPIDFVVMKEDNAGVNFAGLVDSKCYPRCHSYERTGIDKRDFDVYCGLLKFLPVTLIFIDGFERMAYALPLALEHSKATFGNGKAWFELDAMTPLCRLTATDLKAINCYLSPHYVTTKKFFL